VLFAATPLLQTHYNLSHDGKTLLYALGFSLLLSSLKTIPSVLLERELQFGKLVIPQVLENLFYNAGAVYFAWKGLGIKSFTYAVVIRGFVGLFAMYYIKPWIPGIKFSKKSLKKLLNFGVPYQANTLLATIKDDGMTAYLGGILGPSGIGILGWAQKWAYMPLRLFMDHVLKVTFPAFSRMQDKKKDLANSVTRSIFFVCFLVFPSVVGLVLLSPTIVEIIPRYDKWKPALIPLAFISLNTIFAASTTQLTNLLNAIGKIKTTFKLMIMWTMLTWLVIPYLAKRYGVNGAAVGYSFVGASSIIAIYLVFKIVNFSITKSILIPLLGSVLMGMVVYLVRSNVAQSLTGVWVIVGSGVIAYIVFMYILVGKSILYDAKKGIGAIFKRS
jgi:PST family polysaccharide transporter